MYWHTKKQQGTTSSCVTIIALQNHLIVHIFKVKMLYLPSTGFDQLLTLSLETVFTKSTNSQSLEMTAPTPSKPLVCETGRYLDSFDHLLYWELKHIFNRFDSKANSTHTARAKVCKLRVEMYFPSQN